MKNQDENQSPDLLSPVSFSAIPVQPGGRMLHSVSMIPQGLRVYPILSRCQDTIPNIIPSH